MSKAQGEMNKLQSYKGKTAKEWYKLHEVMRKDFSRILAEKEASRNEPMPPDPPYES
jgi:hypothetical protein